jgi:hypothetical protein
MPRDEVLSDSNLLGVSAKSKSGAVQGGIIPFQKEFDRLVADVVFNHFISGKTLAGKWPAFISTCVLLGRDLLAKVSSRQQDALNPKSLSASFRFRYGYKTLINHSSRSLSWV